MAKWTWRNYTDWAKQRDMALRVADRLGRGRGRLRFLDRLVTPVASQYVPNLEDWQDRDLSAVWIGHATVLLRIGGENDPDRPGVIDAHRARPRPSHCGSSKARSASDFTQTTTTD